MNRLVAPGIGTTVAVKCATEQLALLAKNALSQRLEPIRIARMGYALLSGGCSTKAPFPGGVVDSHLVANQKEDGGWADIEETLWCIGYLKALDDKYRAECLKGMEWLDSVRLPCGAWGKSDRDQPRITITALASVLVPSAVGHSGLEWLANQWESDLASPTQLTYKGAFFLLSQAHERAPKVPDLVERTITCLCKEQEEDGGFSPWKSHPVGSDPWTTGIVLWGLAGHASRVPKDIVGRAVSWLQSTQLSNGLWPYHYLDDGTAMALIGLSSVLPVLSER